MAAPSYTTDLATFNDCTSETGWVEMQGMAVGGGVDLDTDLGIVSDRCISELIRKTGLASLAYNNGSGVTIPTNGGFFVWSKYQAPNSIQTRANRGITVVIGSSTTVWGTFNMDGSDTYPYGGWVNYFVDPTLTPDDTSGTYNTTYQYCGTGINVVNYVSKGNPHSIDFMRYGRGESRFTDGDLGNGYATFAGFAAVNDVAATARWGLFSDQGGSYLWKGLMSLGLTSTSVDMRDSNISITIDDTIKASSGFNRIEVHNVSSNVEWNSINITKVGTISKGEFEVIDNATVDLTNCVFTKMSTFIFQSNSTLNDCSFLSCELVTQGSADIDGCIFTNTTGTVALLSDNLNNIDYCDFTSDGTGHAIELTSAHAGSSYTLSGCTFTGYGSTGTTDAAIYNNSGGAVTISVGTGQIPTYYNGAGASTTITGSVDLYIIVKDTLGAIITNALVGVYANDDDTELINQDTDVNGEVDSSYSGTTPRSVRVWIRKASSGATKYINYSSNQTIAAVTGLSLSVTMFEDTNNNTIT